MLTIPSVADLADWSGRPEGSYTTYANSALLQAVILFSTVTELTASDLAAMQQRQNDDGPNDADYLLAFQGMLAMADWIYLRQPYQQIIAAPLQTERIGSYSYSKAEGQTLRNAAAISLSLENTGVVMYDLAVKMLAKRTRAGGVFSGGITIFDGSSELSQTGDTQLLQRTSDGRLVVLGPADRNQMDIPFDVNSEIFPTDPGIG